MLFGIGFKFCNVAVECEVVSSMVAWFPGCVLVNAILRQFSCLVTLGMVGTHRASSTGNMEVGTRIYKNCFMHIKTMIVTCRRERQFK